MSFFAAIKGFLVALLACTLVEQLLVRAVRAVAMSFQPLSGDLTDSAVYHRSLFTPASREAGAVWLLLAVAAATAVAAYEGAGAWIWLTLAALLGALGLDLWFWERVAVSTRHVSWRRGWQQSVRRVPISQVLEVHVVEKPVHLRLGPLKAHIGLCYLALETRDGGVVKLPRTGSRVGRSAVEDVANFVRMQVAIVQEERDRSKNDKRREKIASLDPVEVAIRMQIKSLRKADGEPDVVEARGPAADNTPQQAS